VGRYRSRMAYDEQLAEEVRERLATVDGEVVEKKMFGGLAFMVDGNLAVAASRRGGLLVRTDPGDAEEVESRPGVDPMESAGRRMPGWVFVEAGALGSEADLEAWVDRALAFVATLTAKK
jgi:TfoX/Sxy family transcriptional regulator of competence genes